MESFQEAITQAISIRDEARSLALKLWDQRQTGTFSDTSLVEQLQQTFTQWDECTVKAIKLAPDLKSFRQARRVGPEDGQSQSAFPNYLSQRQGQAWES